MSQEGKGRTTYLFNSPTKQIYWKVYPILQPGLANAKGKRMQNQNYVCIHKDLSDIPCIFPRSIRFLPSENSSQSISFLTILRQGQTET